MVDPIQRILYRGGGILARRIVNAVLPDADIITQEIAIEILSRGFQQTSNAAWNTVRTNIAQQLQATFTPRLGQERTNSLLSGIQTQVNRIARENNIEYTNDNWLTNAQQRLPEGITLDDLQNVAQRDMEAFTREFQRGHRERANEYGERMDMEAEDYDSMVQREIDISGEIMAGMFILQFAT